MYKRRTTLATLAACASIGLTGCSSALGDIDGSSEGGSDDNIQNSPTITGASIAELGGYFISINTAILNPNQGSHTRDLHIRVYDTQTNRLDTKTITTVLPPKSQAAYPIRIPGDGYNPNDVSPDNIEGTLTPENGTPTESDFKRLETSSLTEKTDFLNVGRTVLATDKDGDETIDSMRMAMGIPYDYTLPLGDVQYTVVTEDVATVIEGSNGDIIQYREHDKAPVLENRDDTVVTTFHLSKISALPSWGSSQKGMLVAHHQDHGSSFKRLETGPRISADDQNRM